MALAPPFCQSKVFRGVPSGSGKGVALGSVFSLPFGGEAMEEPLLRARRYSSFKTIIGSNRPARRAGK